MHRPVGGVVKTSQPGGAPMCDCAIPLSDDPRPAPWFVLPTPADVSILAQFNAGQVTSDGGLLWLARADARLGLAAALAECIPDWPPCHLPHCLATLARQTSTH